MGAMTSPLLARLVLLVDETPKPEDVKAGWGALLLFLLLIGAVALLGLSLTKHLRRAQAAEDAGMFGSDAPRPGDTAEPEKHEAS